MLAKKTDLPYCLIPLENNDTFFIDSYAELMISTLKQQNLHTLYISQQIENKYTKLTAHINEKCVQYFSPYIDLPYETYKDLIFITDSAFYEYIISIKKNYALICIDKKLFMSYDGSIENKIIIKEYKDLIVEELSNLTNNNYFSISKLTDVNNDLLIEIAQEFNINLEYIGDETIIFQGEKIDLITAAADIRYGRLPMMLITGEWQKYSLEEEKNIIGIKYTINKLLPYSKYFIFENGFIYIELPSLLLKNQLIQQLNKMIHHDYYVCEIDDNNVDVVHNGKNYRCHGITLPKNMKYELNAKDVIIDDKYTYINCIDGKVIIDFKDKEKIIKDKWKNGDYLNIWGIYIYGKYGKLMSYHLNL